MKQTLFVLLLSALLACHNQSGSVAKTFCDTTCLQDSIKFIKEDFSLRPYVFISASDCLPDSVIWSYEGMGINRKLGFEDLAGGRFPISKNAMICYIKDTSYAWLLFNDCQSGRGFFAKSPFDKKAHILRKSSAINRIDPKFAVAEGLVAYTDKGNIFVEEMATGKKAMMTFGVMTDMDYDAMHEVLDSVNITTNRIWARVKIENEWKTKEKPISLQ